MNLALVNRDFGRGAGTAGYAVGLADWLAQQGHTVTVFASRVRGRLPDGVVLRRLPPVRGGTRGALALAKAVGAIDFTAYDLVQTLDRVPGGDVYRAGGGAHAAWVKARGRGGWNPRHALTVALERRAARRARVVVCNSVMAARDVRRHLGVERARLRVVRNGVDTTRFRGSADRVRGRRRLGLPAGGRIVLFMAHGWERKGLSSTYGAFRLVATAADHLVIAGEERHESHWRRRLSDPRVIWHGHATEPERLLGLADVLCVPTLYDAAANTTLEALACGVPVVTTVFDGSAEVVPEAAWVVHRPRDVASVAEALEAALAANDASRERCREVARSWPVSRNGRAMEAIYEELANG